MSKRLFIIAGEHSGDLHGSLVLSHLKTLNSDITVEGIGGPMMRAAGMRDIYPAEDLAVIGFVEVIRNLGRLLDIYRGIKRHLEQNPPDLLVLIDYPGFNVRIATMAKKMGIKVLYFILPQVWAWNKSRIPKIASVVDEAVVVFPFEVDIWRQAGVKVACFGHPLVGKVEARTSKAEFRAQHQLGNGPVVSLLPGSRSQEIHYILPTMLEAARLIYEKYPDARFVLPLAATIDRQLAQPYVDRACLPLVTLREQTYDAVSACDLALVASGTATLETAILGTPMVIVYQTNFFTALLSRFLIESEYIGLPNVIAGRRVVPEFIRWHFRPQTVADAAIEILGDAQRRTAIVAGLSEVRERLGTPGASQRLAEHLHEMLVGRGPGAPRAG